MKRGNRTGVLPVSKIVKRLPVGRRKSRTPDLGRLAKNLPGGKSAGTAGGVLLGAGAAVAAGRALSRRHSNGSGPDDTEDAKGGKGGKGAKAKSSESDDAERGSEQEDKNNAENPGLFGRLTGTVGKALGGEDDGKGKGGKGGKGGGKKVKVTNIVEHTDIGAPRRLVYDQWTQFQDYPSFMKKVISVDQADEGKLNWKAKIFWSSRTWESTIIEQVPDEHIVWRSKGSKGHVDGTVSFHKLSPNLTRVLLVLEYHPQGLFERTGNIWRAQGRRVRLELKHFGRHVMTQSLAHPDDVVGWRGEIHDSEIVKTHEEALEEEERARKEDAEEYEEYESSDSSR